MIVLELAFSLVAKMLMLRCQAPGCTSWLLLCSSLPPVQTQEGVLAAQVTEFSGRMRWILFLALALALS